jgi:hypothetical protein
MQTSGELEYINLRNKCSLSFLLKYLKMRKTVYNQRGFNKNPQTSSKLCLRRFVVGLPTNALNKIFMSLYAEVDTEEY